MISLDTITQRLHAYTDSCMHVHTITQPCHFELCMHSTEHVTVCMYACVYVCMYMCVCVCPYVYCSLSLSLMSGVMEPFEMCTYLSLVCTPKRIIE